MKLAFSDDEQTILDLTKLLNATTEYMLASHQTELNIDMLCHQCKILEDALASIKNILSGMNGIPVCGPEVAMRYREEV